MVERLSLPNLTRRRFLAGMVAVGGSIASASLLAACGDDEDEDEETPEAAAPSPTTAAQGAAATPTTAASPTEAAVTAATPTEAAEATEAPATATAAPAAEGVPGGTLRATLGAEPTSLDPHKGNTLFDRDVADQLYDALIDDDILDGIQGALAASWESEDATTWVFTLHEDLTFHDGSALTSEEVKLSIERVQNPDTGASGALTRIVKPITSIETPDATTISFTLDAPNATFPLQMADIKIIPPDFDAASPVGSGAFRFAEWERNRHVRVEKNPDYYREGLPYLDEVVFLPTPDESQKIVLLQTGEVEFTDTIPLPRAQEVEQGGEAQVFTIPEGVSPSSYFMLTRTTDAPLNDARVRRAMNFAIDRQALLDATFGYGTIKSNVVPPEHWAFNPDALSFNERDLDQARSLLEEAGYADGFAVQLKHITSRAEFATIAQIVQANLADIGIQMEIIPQEIGVWVEEVLNQHNFQMGLTGIIPAYDPDYMLSRFDTSTADGGAMAWEDAEYQELLAQGRAEVDQDRRAEIYFRMQEIAQEASPGFILNERPIIYGASPAVKGFRPDMRQHTHFVTVWLEQ